MLRIGSSASPYAAAAKSNSAFRPTLSLSKKAAKDPRRAPKSEALVTMPDVSSESWPLQSGKHQG